MNGARRFLREFAAFGGRRIAAGAGLLLLVALIEGIGLLLLIEIVRHLGLDVRPGPGPAGVATSFGAALIFYVAVVAIRGTLERLHNRLTDRLQAGFAAHLRSRLYRALAFADWNFHARHRLADSVHALTQEADRAGAAAHYLQRLIAGTALSLVYVALAVWISPLLTLIVVVGGVLLVIGIRRYTQRAVTSGEAGSASGQALHRAIAEHFSGMKIAKSYSREAQHVAAFEALSADVERASALQVRTSTGVRQRLELGSVVLLVTLLYVSREFVQLPVGDTLLLMFAYARLMPRVTEWLVHAAALMNLLPAFRNVIALESAALAAAEPRSPHATAHVNFSRAIRFDRVSLVYPGQSDAAVSHVDLEIPRGQTIAIVGPSGAGKSTCADLIAGLLQPSSGRVLIDDAVLDGATLPGWRAQVGYVTQDTFLFHDTIRANLTWAAPDATDEAIWEALDRAALGRAVRSWPRGLDTITGDRGVLLSGGERQRLALARALLRRPALLLLDEATSALDSDHEAQVLDAVAELRGGLTIVVISHRPSAVRGADRVYVMDDGRVVESSRAAPIAI